jgi:hypothetical protein
MLTNKKIQSLKFNKVLWSVTTLMIIMQLGSISYASPNPEVGYKIGENLEFNVYFEFVRGGTSRMSVDSAEIDGHTCFHFVSTAKSTRMVDTFYKVRDRVESWQDIDGSFSRRYNKRLREGRYKSDKRVEYLPEDSLAVMFRKKDADAETLSVKGKVFDVLSAFYEVRTRPLEVGKVISIELFDVDKYYTLEVNVLRRETTKVPAGKFDCFVIEPRLKSEGLFRREGSMHVWITADDHRMPVLMRSRLYFGRVWAKLTKYQLGKE